MKKTTQNIIKLIGILLIAWGLYQGGSYLYWYQMAWSAPDQAYIIDDKMRTLPSKEVVKKLHSFDIFSPYPQTAIKVLAERKEKQAVPELIKLTKSWNKHIRRDAIWALGLINDKRAIAPLMKIVKEDEKKEEYGWALLSLAKMQYEGAFSYVVKLAKADDALANGSIALLREFGRPECIPLLLGIKNKIKDTDPLSKFDKSQIDDAIKYIESQN